MMAKKKVGPEISEQAEKFYRENFANVNAGTAYVLGAFPGMYGRAMADMRGVFSRGELMLMLDVCNGLWLTPALAGEHITIQVADGMEIDRLDEKWKIDKKQLLEKLQKLSTLHLACLEIWAEAFWGQEEHGNKQLEKWVKKLS
jgi:hypothetical protein